MPLPSALAILLACAPAEDSAAAESATAPAVRTLIADYTCVDGVAEWADGEPVPLGSPVAASVWLYIDYGDEWTAWEEPIQSIGSAGFMLSNSHERCVSAAETSGRIVYSYTE